MTRVTLSLVASFIVGFSLASCGIGAGVCNTSNCGGCCDSAGKCMAGDTAAACGAGANQCAVCSGTCAEHACSGGPVDGGAPDAGPAFVCTRTTVACSDAAIAALDLAKVDPAPGLVTNTPDGTAPGAFKSVVDSRAGGFSPTESFVYAKFTTTGLEKVSLSDAQANDSMEWDIAFRRFMIRLNGGDSGPSCVSGAITTKGTTYESVTAEPAGVTWLKDDFLSDAPSCSFQDDRSGLTTTPSTVLSQDSSTTVGDSFYTYAGCVTMTGRTFVVKAHSGRTLKLVVTGYYQSEADQASCNLGTPAAGAVGGNIRLRWAFLN